MLSVPTHDCGSAPHHRREDLHHAPTNCPFPKHPTPADARRDRGRGRRVGWGAGARRPDLQAGRGCPATVLNGPIWPSGPLNNVVIHNLYMDTNWDAHNPAGLQRATIDDFTTQLLATGYFSKATQYGVASASFTGSDQAIAACPPPGPTFDYFAMSSWILCEKHSLPSSSTNNVNLWQVYVPVNAGLNMQISWPWGGSWQLATAPSGCPPGLVSMGGRILLGADRTVVQAAR
jgi:hypothetical protein